MAPLGYPPLANLARLLDESCLVVRFVFIFMVMPRLLRGSSSTGVWTLCRVGLLCGLGATGCGKGPMSSAPAGPQAVGAAAPAPISEGRAPSLAPPSSPPSSLPSEVPSEVPSSPRSSPPSEVSPVPQPLEVALEDAPRCLQFLDAETVLYTTGWPPTVRGRTVDARTGAFGAEVDPRKCAPSRSADGAWVLATDASAGTSAVVEIRNAATGKLRARFSPWRKRVFEYDSGYLLVARFFPEGDRIALLLAEDVTRGATLSIWSQRQRRIVRELALTTLDDDNPSLIAPTPGEALAVSADGRFVFAGNFDTAVHVFDLGAEGQERSLPTDLSVVTALALSPDGRWLAATGQGRNRAGSVTAFEVATGRRLGSVPAPGDCDTLAISPDGGRVAVSCKRPAVAGPGAASHPMPRVLLVFTAAQLGI